MLCFLDGADFNGAVPFSVTFSAADTADNPQCINIPLIADSLVEAVETFGVELNLPSAANPLVQEGTPSSVTVSITGKETVCFYH